MWVGGNACTWKERKKNTPPSARPASDGAGRVRGHDHWRLSFPCEVDGRMGLLMADSPYPARVLPV
jgi:hypothetical protein